MPVLLDSFTAAFALDRPGQTVAQCLAEHRIHSQLADYLQAALYRPMIEAYVTGFQGGDAPTDERTPQAVILAFLLGADDRHQDRL